MKKSLRIASILLALVLVTSCFVGGTFAKYVTGTEDVTDSARVAKWGVVVKAVEAGAFAASYEADAQVTDKDGEVITTTVLSANGTDKVVAPGTEGTFGGVDISGTPEVAVNVAVNAELKLENWEVDGEFYCPIIFTFGEDTTIDGKNYTSADDLIEAVEAAIAGASGNYEPNTDLSTVTGLNGDYGWEWPFYVSDENDVKDTALGDAATAATISLTVGATVTQID